MVAQCGCPVGTTLSQGVLCEQEPSTQEVHACTPKHRSLQHLQAINLAFDLSVAPTQREASFHCVIVLSFPLLGFR